jgi:heme-degrading monooxygenase HmoA
MFVVVWEYEVRDGAAPAFEALYGPEGDWVALFREHAGFIGTELLRGADGRYMTLDRWTSADDYEAFLTAAKPRYAHIDARGDALTLTERRLGAFTTP